MKCTASCAKSVWIARFVYRVHQRKRRSQLRLWLRPIQGYLNNECTIYVVLLLGSSTAYAIGILKSRDNNCLAHGMLVLGSLVIKAGLQQVFEFRSKILWIHVLNEQLMSPSAYRYVSVEVTPCENSSLINWSLSMLVSSCYIHTSSQSFIYIRVKACFIETSFVRTTFLLAWWRTVFLSTESLW